MLSHRSNMSMLGMILKVFTCCQQIKMTESICFSLGQTLARAGESTTAWGIRRTRAAFKCIFNNGLWPLPADNWQQNLQEQYCAYESSETTCSWCVQRGEWLAASQRGEIFFPMYIAWKPSFACLRLKLSTTSEVKTQLSPLHRPQSFLCTFCTFYKSPMDCAIRYTGNSFNLCSKIAQRSLNLCLETGGAFSSGEGGGECKAQAGQCSSGTTSKACKKDGHLKSCNNQRTNAAEGTQARNATRRESGRILNSSKACSPLRHHLYSTRYTLPLTFSWSNNNCLMRVGRYTVKDRCKHPATNPAMQWTFFNILLSPSLQLHLTSGQLMYNLIAWLGPKHCVSQELILLKSCAFLKVWHDCSIVSIYHALQ